MKVGPRLAADSTWKFVSLESGVGGRQQGAAGALDCGCQMSWQKSEENSALTEGKK